MLTVLGMTMLVIGWLTAARAQGAEETPRNVVIGITGLVVTLGLGVAIITLLSLGYR